MQAIQAPPPEAKAPEEAQTQIPSSETVPLPAAPPPPSPQTSPYPVYPAPTTPMPPAPQTTTPYPVTQPATAQQDWSVTPYSTRVERHRQNQAAGLPIWGVLLIVVGAIALIGNFGIGLGWLFGLALGAWFVYMGLHHLQEGKTINWWLVGLGLLIGLGAISSGFLDRLVFPLVLLVVGLGILVEYGWNRQAPRQ